MKTASIKVHRYNKDLKEAKYIKVYDFSLKKDETLLDVLDNIKHTKDSSLTYRSSCRSGVCGSCSMKVNNKEVLACKHKVKHNDEISALGNKEIIKDLVVDLENEAKILFQAKTFLQEYKEEKINKKDTKLIDIQSNCILCQSCYSSCPVYEVKKDFLGPFVLTRVLRYVNDKKETNKDNKLKEIQNNGIWDCTLCGNCTLVCPQGIDPKNDILNLRMKSIQEGYEDPTVQVYEDFNSSFDSGFDANFDSGFNPNF